VDRPRRNGKAAAAKRTRPHGKAETEHAAS